MARTKTFPLWLAVLLLAAPRLARADEVPPGLALTVMLKVLTYDSEFEKHGKGEFLVLVPYPGKDSELARQTIAVAESIEQKTILGRSLRYLAVPLSELDARVAELKPAALLASRGTSEQAGRDLGRLAASARLYTLSLEPSLVEQSLTLGVGLKEGRPQVVINVTAARAAGVDFKPTVLKVARTVQ